MNNLSDVELAQRNFKRFGGSRSTTPETFMASRRDEEDNCKELS